MIPDFKPPHAFQALGGVAVIADNTWAAFQGRKKLKVDWDPGANAAYTSSEYKKELQSTARKPGKVVRNLGDVDKGFAAAAKTLEADYYVPLLSHAQMEPVNAVADFRDGGVPSGRRCRIRKLRRTRWPRRSASTRRMWSAM